MNTLELMARGAVMGVASSALIDVWAFSLRRGFHIDSLDYRLLGRWLGNFAHCTFSHPRITSAPSIRGERALGWAAHYGIGIGFALALLAFAGDGWAAAPTIAPAMFLGVGTVAAPWLIMQPAFGAGVAGSKTPHPWQARIRNLGTHSVYGLGLYLSALGLAVF